MFISRPQLVIATLMQIFQQFAGINAIMFYAPVLFQTVGFKNNASLLSAVITATVNVLCTVVFVDRAGRRILLLSACILMLIARVNLSLFLFFSCQARDIDSSVVFFVLQTTIQATNNLHQDIAMVVVVIFVCVFVGSFAWSWGPLGWLIPRENVSSGDEDIRFRLCSELQHALHFHHRAGFPVHDVPLTGMDLLLLCVDCGHGALRCVPRDKERAHR